MYNTEINNSKILRLKCVSKRTKSLLKDGSFGELGYNIFLSNVTFWTQRGAIYYSGVRLRGQNLKIHSEIGHLLPLKKIFLLTERMSCKRLQFFWKDENLEHFSSVPPCNVDIISLYCILSHNLLMCPKLFTILHPSYFQVITWIFNL